MLARGIGDNSAAYGEELREEIEDALSDGQTVRFRYIDLHIGDWLGGTQKMNCEHEGAYWRFLVRLYANGKPLEDDDRLMASCMNLSVRVWRRLREALVAMGKIIARAGYLTNERFEEERQKRAAQIKKQSEAVQKRWRNSKAIPQTSAKFAGSLDETSPNISGNLDAKSRKNKDLQDSQLIPPIPQYPIPTLLEAKPLEREEERDALPSPPPTARRSGLVEQDEWEIRGPGFVLPYGSVDMEATLRGVPVNRARQLAMSLAEGWVANKHRPGAKAVAEFIRALREEATERTIQAAKLDRFSKFGGVPGQPGRPPGVPDFVWDEICREREAARG